MLKNTYTCRIFFKRKNYSPAFYNTLPYWDTKEFDIRKYSNIYR